jgi:hypothetical protein
MVFTDQNMSRILLFYGSTVHIVAANLQAQRADRVECAIRMREHSQILGAAFMRSAGRNAASSRSGIAQTLSATSTTLHDFASARTASCASGKLGWWY